MRAGRILPAPRGNPRKWGPGKGDYEHEVLIRSRPRWRFGYFAAMGKVTRRPQAAKFPLRKEPSSGPMRASGPTKKRSIIAPSSVTASPCHLSLSPLAFGHLPLTRGVGPRGEGFFGGEPPHPPQCAHWGTFPPGGRLADGPMWPPLRWRKSPGRAADSRPCGGYRGYSLIS